MTHVRPRRSVLYMPASNARALEKAKTLPTDGLVLDLEDAVAPDAKASAREALVAAIKGGGYGKREVIARINALVEWSAIKWKAALSLATLYYTEYSIRLHQEDRPWLLANKGLLKYTGDPETTGHILYDQGE